MAGNKSPFNGIRIIEVPEKNNDAVQIIARRSTGDPLLEQGELQYIDKAELFAAELFYKTVEDYGAVGDGITDDTTAIQSALSSLVSGDYLIFNSPSYLVSADMTFTASNVIIDGKNCLITENTLTTATITGSDSNNSIIKNFRFQGTENLTNWQAGNTAYRSASRNFVRFLNCNNVIIENITGLGKRGNVMLQNCFDSSVINNYQTGFFGQFTATTIPAISDPQYCRNVTMTGGRYNTAENNSAYETGCIVTFSQNGFNNIVNNHGEYLHDNGIYNSSGPYNNIIGNHIQWVVGSGIKSRGNSNIILSNNIRHVGVGISCTGDGTTSIDAYNANGRYNDVSHNTISDTFTGPALSILNQDGYYSRDVKVTNNSIFEHNSLGGQNAVRIITTKGLIFKDNTIQDIDSDYAVEIRGVVSPVQINKNVIVDNNQIIDCKGGFIFNYLEDSFITNNTIKNSTAIAVTASNSNNNYIFNTRCYNVFSGITFDNTCIGNRMYNNDGVTGTSNTDNFIITDQNASGVRAFISDVNAKVADAIVDGVTTIAPSQNAVFDALALKENAQTGTGIILSTAGVKSYINGSNVLYVRADGTTANFTTTVRATSLAGLPAGSNTPITASNTILSGLADLQAQINNKAPLDSPDLTGNPKAPTPTAGDNDTSIATTAFVQGELLTVTLEKARLNGNLVEGDIEISPDTVFGSSWKIFSGVEGQDDSSYKEIKMTDDAFIQIKNSLVDGITGDLNEARITFSANSFEVVKSVNGNPIGISADNNGMIVLDDLVDKGLVGSKAFTNDGTIPEQYVQNGHLGIKTTARNTNVIVDTSVATSYRLNSGVSTVTLPILTGKEGTILFFVNNSGSDITLNSNAGANDIWSGGTSVNTETIPQSTPLRILHDGTSWVIL